MAKADELAPSDLVWRKETGTRWIRADCIEGLFPDAPEEPVVVEAEDAPAPPQPAGDKRVRKLGPITWILVAAAVLAAIAVGVVLVAERLYLAGKPIPGLPVFVPKVSPAEEEASRQAALAAARSNRVTELAALVKQYLDQERIEEAMAALSELQEYEAPEELMSPLTRRLGKIEKLAVRREQLKQVLRKGSLTPALAKELFNICRMQAKTEDLLHLVEVMLDDPEFLTPGAALSSVRVCLVSGQDALLRRALNGFVLKSPKKGPFADYLEVANVYCSIGKAEEAKALLEAYLKNEPEVWQAWLELAAMTTSAQDIKPSLAAVKQATEHGGNVARDIARKDSRFASIRNTRSFKRYVKPQ
jgi:tetratricopeptide (TPR) repeat protein